MILESILKKAVKLKIFSLANDLQLAEGGALGVPTRHSTINIYLEPKSFCNHVHPVFDKVLLVVAISFLSVGSEYSASLK